ncbi:MAG: Holliday junction resolvase RuvX [Candidatus Pacebacteria bacterium]|nr:Holliday junction resolvase RuvX [Candidatus Paceibacterota bacterium]
MMKKYLAIDYGDKRIGLAVNQASLAEPLFVLENSPNVREQVKVICQERDIDQVIIGLSEQEMANKTRQFGQKLKEIIDIPLSYYDETLSTQEVRKKLLTGPAKKKKRQGPVDHYAAALILERWLETV